LIDIAGKSSPGFAPPATLSIRRNPPAEKRARCAAERQRPRVRVRWSEWLAHDPAYSPNLTLARESASLAFPPRVALPRRDG
jgi:hypothetical protein